MYFPFDTVTFFQFIDTNTNPLFPQACLKRGLNPYGVTREDQMSFLQTWTSLSQHLDGTLTFPAVIILLGYICHLKTSTVKEHVTLKNNASC